MSDVVLTDGAKAESEYSEYEQGWRSAWRDEIFCNPFSVNAPGAGADYERGFFNARFIYDSE